MTAMQLSLVGEVVDVWHDPIREERKNWAKDYLEKQLRKKHDGKLTQVAAEALTTRDRLGPWRGW